MNLNRRIVVLGCGVALLWYLDRSRSRGRRCTECPSCSALQSPQDQGTEYPLTDGLYPLRHPMFCAREAATHCALLEDHLTSDQRRCKNCIQKHFLMAEGFLKEGMLMDKHQKYTDFLTINLRRLHPIIGEYLSGANPNAVAQKLRELRTSLSETSFPYYQ